MTSGATFLVLLITTIPWSGLRAQEQRPAKEMSFTLHPIGTMVKELDRSFIVLDRQFTPGLMGPEDFSHVTVVYWFDRNDTPKKRSILQVHPQGDPANPLRGVFATRAPVRPT